MTRATVAVLIGVAAAALLLCGCTGVQNTGDQAPSQDVVPGEYIVSLKPTEDSETVRKVYGEYEIAFLNDLGRGRYLMRLSKDPGLESLKRKAAASGKIESIQPNFRYRLPSGDVTPPRR